MDKPSLDLAILTTQALRELQAEVSNPDGVIKLQLKPCEAARWVAHLKNTEKTGQGQRISAEKHNSIISLTAQGISTTQIARLMECTCQTVTGAVYRERVRTRIEEKRCLSDRS